jgi:hypothetical protein
VIGTSHPIQRDINNTDFRLFINESIKKFSIQAIAEEINVLNSVASIISHEVDIDYQVIEPNEHERVELGIDTLNQIGHDIFMDFDDCESPEAFAECEERKQSAFRAREQEWLRRIKEVQISPILVICGANHVSQFSALLTVNGFDVVIENALWE